MCHVPFLKRLWTERSETLSTFHSDLPVASGLMQKIIVTARDVLPAFRLARDGTARALEGKAFPPYPMQRLCVLFIGSAKRGLVSYDFAPEIAIMSTFIGTCSSYHAATTLFL